MLFGNTLKKLKAKKMYSEDVRHVKNLKCCAGSTTSLCGHLRNYHPKICKKAEDKIKRRSSKKSMKKKNQIYERFAITRSRAE